MNEFDQRYAKRRGNKFATSTAAFTEGRSLCAVCTKKKDCSVLTNVKSMNEQGYGVELRNCENFGLSIPFDSDKGVFSKFVNTFRIGTGMVNRLSKGSEVTLVENKTGAIIRSAIVSEIDMGPLDLMVREHGANNHLVKDYDDEDEAKEVLSSYINRTYGPHMTQEGKKPFSVVYFK